MKNKKRGFTLIELLVVIAIIGILATLAVVSLQNARKNARDAKRIADVRQVQTALELFYNDWQQYPQNNVFSTGAISSGTIYMAVTPSAPTPADGTCSTTANTYVYATSSSSYSIKFCLGAAVSGLSAGEQCASPSGIVSTSTCP